MAYTSDDLVNDVRRDQFLTVAQDHFSPAQILNIADQELHQTLLPLLISLDDGFNLEAADTAFVSGTSDYEVSRYAMYGKVRMVTALRSDGTERQLVRVTPEQAHLWEGGSGDPEAFQILADQIRVYPTPSSATESLRQWIYRRPGRLVPTSSAAMVSTAVTTTVTYTASKPATFTATSVHDFYRGTSPFRRVATAATATGSPLATTQTFSAANVALLTANDWVCVRDESVFPAIPLELVPFLKDLVMRSLSRSQMDEAQYQVQRAEIVDRVKSVMKAPGQRVMSTAKKISIDPARVFGGGRRGWFR
jgi:hypothetical protein